MLYRPVIEEPYLRPAASELSLATGWIYGIRFPSEKASACPIFVNEKSSALRQCIGMGRCRVDRPNFHPNEGICRALPLVRTRTTLCR